MNCKKKSHRDTLTNVALVIVAIGFIALLTYHTHEVDRTVETYSQHVQG